MSSPYIFESIINVYWKREIYTLTTPFFIKLFKKDIVPFINLEFPFNTDMDEVEQKVNEYMGDTNLPENVQTKGNRFSFGTFPIYNISLFAKDDVDLEKILEEEIIPQLNKIEGINSVSVGGLKEELLQITIDKQKAQAAGLSLDQIKQQINQKYLSFPAGNINIDDLNIPIRVEESLDAIKELEDLQLSSSFAQPNTPPVQLKDIATIKKVTDQPELTRYNLQDSLSMAITKKQDANTVQVAEEVLDVLNAYSDEVDYAIGFDSAEGIKKSVETLIKEGLLGALFASIAVLIFLRNVRATIIAIISIPLSLLVTSIFLYRLDISLNIMTLGGMAVAVGRVVDDSIVVIENIFRRVRKSKDLMLIGIVTTNAIVLVDRIGQNREEKGMAIREALIEAGKTRLRPILMTAFATVAALIPLALTTSSGTLISKGLAITVVGGLTSSTLLTLIIVPVVYELFFFKQVKKEKQRLVN